MVPNVYGMSQHADGGLMTTKPYVSGSAYLKKMGDYPKGEWERVWDGLYWRFVANHTEFFRANPRMSMMAALAEKLGPKLDEHRRVADGFLGRFHG
jgi:deoxyribodipyrimidine photolyase-related protein